MATGVKQLTMASRENQVDTRNLLWQEPMGYNTPAWQIDSTNKSDSRIAPGFRGEDPRLCGVMCLVSGGGGRVLRSWKFPLRSPASRHPRPPGSGLTKALTKIEMFFRDKQFKFTLFFTSSKILNSVINLKNCSCLTMSFFSLLGYYLTSRLVFVYGFLKFKLVPCGFSTSICKFSYFICAYLVPPIKLPGIHRKLRQHFWWIKLQIRPNQVYWPLS